MRKVLVFIQFVLFITWNPCLYASVTCTQPTAENVQKEKKVYTFRAKTTCQITEVENKIGSLADYFMEDIKNTNTIKIHKQEAYEKDGFTGYALDLTENLNSGHGQMAIRSNAIIVDDGSSRFYLSGASSSIVADGDAKNTKSVKMNMSVEDHEGKIELVLIKETKIEKPWFAPEGMFLRKVKEGMIEELRKAAATYSQKVSSFL